MVGGDGDWREAGGKIPSLGFLFQSVGSLSFPLSPSLSLAFLLPPYHLTPISPHLCSCSAPEKSVGHSGLLSGLGSLTALHPILALGAVSVGESLSRASVPPSAKSIAWCGCEEVR